MSNVANIPTGLSPGRMDAAETFDGSDGETVTHSSTEVRSGGVALQEDTTTRPGDNSSETKSEKRGLVINPNESISNVLLGVSANVSGATTAYVRDTSGNTLGSASISGGQAYIDGLSLASGTDYLVQLDDGGASYSPGYYDAPSFPYSGTSLDITAGAFGTSTTTNFAYNIDSVKTGAVSGSVVVEWPMPDDLAGWDIVPYEAVKNGGGVDLYVEDSNGNELLGPLDDPGDISSVDASTNPRIRADFSRTSTSENPRLEAVWRRRKFI